MMQRTTAYDDRPIRQTHPQVIADALSRWSLEPPLLETLRVLEVGCAHGVNLMAIAARFPRASFVGIDIDVDAIEIATSRAAQAQLPNVRFEAVDSRAFHASEESFDLAIAHGFLSWVPPQTGRALFEMFARILSPQGMAYVSYDTKPGACMRDALGLALRAARDVDGALALLHHGDALRGTHGGAWLDAEIDAALDRPRSFLEQQYLSPDARALSFSDVWDLAAEYGLHYIDDVADTGLPDDAVRASAEAAARITTDRRGAEQLLDVAILRQFRASVFARCPPGRRVEIHPELASEAHAVPVRPRVLPLTQLEARELGFVSTARLDARALHPLHALLIAHCDGTRDLEHLARLVVEAVRVETLALPSASGAPASVEEVEQGAATVVEAALLDLLRAGLVFE